jgi:hypothetical protein
MSRGLGTKSLIGVANLWPSDVRDGWYNAEAHEDQCEGNKKLHLRNTGRKVWSYQAQLIISGDSSLPSLTGTNLVLP